MTAKGELTRDELVDCAQRLFYEHGYDGTSFTQIVEASGLRRGHIYHYFKSKDDILRAVVDRRREEFDGLLASLSSAFSDPRARLEGMLDMIVSRGGELVEFGCPIGSLNMELAKDRRDLQIDARGLLDLLAEWLTGCFAELGRREDARRLALHFLARLQGIALIAHAYRDREFLRDEAAGLKAWVGTLTGGVRVV